jgi:hypothetical protein
MNPPIHFPDDADVIADEAARFRALSADRRVLALGECFRDYLFLAEASGRPVELDRFAVGEERRGRAAIEEFVARHHG